MFAFKMFLSWNRFPLAKQNMIWLIDIPWNRINNKSRPFQTSIDIHIVIEIRTSHRIILISKVKKSIWVLRFLIIVFLTHIHYGKIFMRSLIIQVLGGKLAWKPAFLFVQWVWNSSSYDSFCGFLLSISISFNQFLFGTNHYIYFGKFAVVPNEAWCKTFTRESFSSSHI